MPPTLPDCYLITPEPPADAHEQRVFISHLETALVRGVRLVQLRAKALEPQLYALLAHEVAALCETYDAHLMLNGPLPDSGLNSACHAGLHLSSTRLMAWGTSQHRPICASNPPETRRLSAACHNLAQLQHAQAIGADFVTLSPVLATTSHPGAPTLGWAAFAALAAQVDIPIYALGGMTMDALATAKAHGAHGIAAIRALWA